MPEEIYDLKTILAQKKEGTLVEPPLPVNPALEEAEEEVASGTTEAVAEPTETEEETSEDAILAADEEEAEEAGAEPVKKEKHRSKAAEARIAKLVREKEALRGQLALYQQQATPETTTQQFAPVIDPSQPDPSKYAKGEDDIDFRLDLREYQRNLLKKDQTFKESLEQAKATKYPDLQRLMETDTTPPNPTMVKLIKESEIGVDLLHFLLSNDDVAKKIAGMSPEHVAKEIGKLEAKLEEKVKVTTKSVNKKTPLPAPISPVSTGKAASLTKQTKYTVY